MSRSYRKPFCTFENKAFAKRLANKKVRHSTDVANGKQFKKHYDSYNITDLHIYVSKHVDPIWHRKMRRK